MEESTSIPPRPRRRRPRRPERQQIMLRRALALGVGLLILILLVLGIRGCLDARKKRGLSDYAGDVTQIVEETKQTSESFFGKLNDPGELSVTDFVGEVNAERSAVDSYRDRVEGLDVPGDMNDAQVALELVYELRSSAMNRIANRMSTALGDVGAKRATAVIANQMRILLASDVLYGTVARPRINNVLAANGIEGDDVPQSVFLPGEARWLDRDAVASALGSVTGASGAATPGVHGMGLLGTSVNGTELSSEGSSTIATEGETPELEVEIQNQGESTENGVTVSVTVGGNTLQESVDSIGAGETSTVTIPLTPAPRGSTKLEVEVEPVPGEKVTENNSASYTVVFQ